jgi:hypothetical protein
MLFRVTEWIVLRLVTVAWFLRYGPRLLTNAAVSLLWVGTPAKGPLD